MPLINTIEVIDRNNRPQVSSRVMLRTFFLNDGLYVDPYAISSVHVFSRAQSLSPGTVLNAKGIVSVADTSTAAMVFGPSDTGIVHGVNKDLSFNENKYTGEITSDSLVGNACSGVSGVYRLGLGEFACVLDGNDIAALSGIDQNGNVIRSSASAAMRYSDIWTVKLTAASAWKTYINDFELFDNTFISVTEPLLLRAKNTLFNRSIINGSKTNLKIGTEITIENKNIDDSIKNIIKGGLITSATIQVQKVNDDPSLPGRYNVVKDATVNLITSDNTIIYPFDTSSALVSGDNTPEFSIDELGSRTGTYAVRVKYRMINERIVSPWMYFVIK